MESLKINNLEQLSNENQSIKYPVDQVIREGSAEIVSGGAVFYNPVQEFNRDLSVSVLNVYFKQLLKERAEKQSTIAKNHGTEIEDSSPPKECKEYIAGEKYVDGGLRILEALSATGLRSIRYAKEIAGVHEIVANDLSKQAVESIKENVRHNKVSHLIEPSLGDAMTVMYLSTAPNKRFDAVDLDPYGCPNRFLDGAVQSLADGGILLVTATDMAVLAGNTPEACFVKYGTVALRMKCCHEMALRILLNTIETHANRYGRYIEPLLSVSADFYIRIFVRIYTSQAQCKYSMSKNSMIYQCTGCDTFTLQPLGILKPNPTEKNPNGMKFSVPTGIPVDSQCKHCGHKHHLGGPIWSAPIHNKVFVQELLDEILKPPLWDLGTQRRLIGILSVILEELEDIPLYYCLDKLCSVVKLQTIPMLKFRSAILHEGYRVSFSHAAKNSIKTDAPPEILWDILRCWHKRHPVKEERIQDGTPIKAILSQPCMREYKFDDTHPEANPSSRKNALTRFQANPTAYWGPGTRATIMIGDKKLPKSVRNQNKKQKFQSKGQQKDEKEEAREKSTIDDASNEIDEAVDFESDAAKKQKFK